MENNFIPSLLLPALRTRAPLLEGLHAENTTCYRLFHGTNEGAPGLTLDRYGDYLLVQTWREPLPLNLLPELEAAVKTELNLDLQAVWNHRATRGSVDHSLHPLKLPFEITGAEQGLIYNVTPRHQGVDPLLFLDFRAGRRKIREVSAGKTVLNLFSYTGGIGLAAASGGATEVINVDFSKHALEVSETNAFKNGLHDAFTTTHEDAIPIMLQYSGLGVHGRRAKRHFKKVEPRQFDIVVLDPPRYAKGSFGLVDTVGDYQSLFKPALLCTRPGGRLLVTNNVASVSRDEFTSLLERCAEKIERPFKSIEYLDLEGDFPSPDGKWPLKMAWIELS